MAKHKPSNLSVRQLEHLNALAISLEPRGSYPRLNMNTLRSLRERKLVTCIYGRGSMAMPHTSIKWSLTPAGREEWRKYYCTGGWTNLA